jgi:hypothetical protein
LALAVGFGAGGVVGAYSIQRAMYTDASDLDAADTIERVEVLSRLRLGETQLAITILEDPLPRTVLFLTSTEAKAARTRDDGPYRALLAAKAYWSVFPATQVEGEAVDEALKDVPLLQDKVRYTDGLNKLVERYQSVPLAPSTGT